MVIGTILMGLLTALVSYLHMRFGSLNLRIPYFFHTVLGFVVGLLLVFRTNKAYDRWWEGRVSLSNLIMLSRVLASRFDHYLPDSAGAQRKIIKRLIPAYAWSLRQSLRDDDYSGYQHYIPEEFFTKFLAANNKPMFLLEIFTAIIAGHAKNETLPIPGPLVLENQIQQLANVQSTCERIRTSPIPISYGLHLKRILLIYLLTMPFGFVGDLTWYSIPAAMLVFYTLVGIELIGEEIEDPFGEDLNDLPFDDILEEIERDVAELLADP